MLQLQDDELGRPTRRSVSPLVVVIIDENERSIRCDHPPVVVDQIIQQSEVLNAFRDLKAVTEFCDVT
jgi:hypothetical protein